MFTRPSCVDCRCLAPETKTYYTLIGPTHGWRMTRTTQPDGTLLIDWRCPPCWRKYKISTGTKASYPSSGKLPVSQPASGSSVPPAAVPAKPSKSSR
jgi:hypothetical protein